MSEICTDNRFEIIERAKKHLLDATNIEASEDEMKVIDTFLFRCWQMGWLDRYETQEEQDWIPCSKRLPKTDNKNAINDYNVLLLVKEKIHPDREPQIYLGKLKHVAGDDGSGNIWGIKTKPCDWTIWGWSYFNEPEVIAWRPLPEKLKGGESK